DALCSPPAKRRLGVACRCGVWLKSPKQRLPRRTVWNCGWKFLRGLLHQVCWGQSMPTAAREYRAGSSCEFFPQAEFVFGKRLEEGLRNCETYKTEFSFCGCVYRNESGNRGISA